MTLDKLFETDRQDHTVQPREAHIRETVTAARHSFLRAEAERPLSPWTFLQLQLTLLQKRWWLAQLMLFALVGAALPDLAEIQLVARSLGVTAALFVILLIPEFARNTNADALEVESTTHFTLRHIYAARLLLFGGFDLVLLTGFCGVCASRLGCTFMTLVSQFLLPLVVTACLCFGLLTKRQNGLTAICTCLFWGGIWWLFVLNDTLYAAVTTPVWLGLFALSIGFLTYLIRQWIHTSTQQWEVNSHGTLYQ